MTGQVEAVVHALEASIADLRPSGVRLSGNFRTGNQVPAARPSTHSYQVENRSESQSRRGQPPGTSIECSPLKRTSNRRDT